MVSPRKTWLRFWVGQLLYILTLGRSKPEKKRLERMEFGSSCQKMGIRFTEKMRDRWRRRWLRLKK